MRGKELQPIDQRHVIGQEFLTEVECTAADDIAVDVPAPFGLLVARDVYCLCYCLHDFSPLRLDVMIRSGTTSSGATRHFLHKRAELGVDQRVHHEQGHKRGHRRIWGHGRFVDNAGAVRRQWDDIVPRVEVSKIAANCIDGDRFVELFALRADGELRRPDRACGAPCSTTTLAPLREIVCSTTYSE
jgi:hypothetical protein